MVVLISGTDKQLSIFKALLRQKVPFIWYTYDFMPKQILEYINIDARSEEVSNVKLINRLVEAFDEHSDVCYKDCMSVIENYKADGKEPYCFIVVPNKKMSKFKTLKAARVNVITDPNLVSGAINEKYSIYDYNLYNAHDKKTMNRKVNDFLSWCERNRELYE